MNPRDNLKVTRKTGLGNLARYITRACFSQERLVYIPTEKSDDGNEASSSETRQNWARLIQKIYGVPFNMPKMPGSNENHLYY